MPNPSTVNAYVICLERSGRCDQTMASIRQTFARAERMPAVDGHLINVPDDPRVSLQAVLNMHHGYDIEYAFTRKGEIGCYLSHANIWERCVQENAPCIAIEDDIHITTDMRVKIHKALREVPHDADLLQIMWTWPAGNRCNHGDWCEVTSKFVGTMMYYITPRGARILLSRAYPAQTSVDTYMGFCAQIKPDFRAYYYRDRIYSREQIRKDDLRSTIGHFHTLKIWRLLPRNNQFFYAVGGGILVLVVALAISIRKNLKK